MQKSQSIFQIAIIFCLVALVASVALNLILYKEKLHLLSIIHCFSSRLYGLRKYKAKVKKIVDGLDPCSE